MMAILYPMEELRNYIEEVRIRVGKPDAVGRQVLSVTNVDGLTKSDRRTSDDLSNYLCVEEGFFAYNPYRINVGSIGLARERNQVGVVSPAYVVFRTKSTLLPEYLLFLLHSPYGLAQIRRLTSGSVRQTLRFAALCRFRLPLPPLPVQRRIAAVLERADELRRKRAEADRLTDQVLPALFVKMFGDPATNPMGWPQVSIASLVTDSQNGLSRRRKHVQNIGYIVLRIRDIQRGQIDLSGPNRIPMSKEEFDKYRLKKDDLIFARLNGNLALVGKCAIFDLDRNDIAFNDHLIRFRFDRQRIEPLYIFHVLTSPYGRAQIESRAVTTAGQFSVGARRLGQIPVPLPPLTIQRQFSERCQHIKQHQQQQAQSRTTLDALFQTLLARAFRGELVTGITLAEAFDLSQRQATLLALLAAAAEVRQPEPVHITPLMKYAFLFQQEGGRAARADDQLALPLAAEARALYLPGEWYDFVPHKYGPFAKELYDDLEALEAAGLVERRHPPKAKESLREKTAIYLADEKAEAIRDLVDSLPAEVRQGIEAIVTEYGSLDQKDLLDVVYRRYPEYTVNSERPGWGSNE